MFSKILFVCDMHFCDKMEKQGWTQILKCKMINIKVKRVLLFIEIEVCVFWYHQYLYISDGPVSPGHMAVSMATVSAGNKPDSVNLMKWFGTDVLKTSLPTMPPLPVQGQRVLTLDEIERL